MIAAIVNSVVNGVLLAVILATWMWTYWWHRRIMARTPMPDYEAAEGRLTTELILMFGSDRDQMPLAAHRAVMARNVVDEALWPEKWEGQS